MRHRIFIAINLPDDIRKRLSDYQKKWITLPVRWTKKDNLHITLIFLGYLNDEELLEIIKVTKEIASKNQPFSINLNKILYGPPHQHAGEGQAPQKIPRMVWALGEPSQELANLQRDLENALYSSTVKGVKEGEIRAYAPHITLARIKTWEFRRIEPEERQDVNEEISLIFPVESIEVMESNLNRGGPEYIILESASLKS